MAETVKVLPAVAVVDGDTFIGTACPVAGLIVTVADCPEPVSPGVSETETLNTQFVVTPEAVDTYENDGTLHGLMKSGHPTADHAYVGL